MLEAGGATVRLMGFRRGGQPLPTRDKCAVVDLGQTHNGQFAHRMAAVLRTLAVVGSHKAAFEAADVIIARNLEMLAVGVRGRSLCKGKPTLAYESLDIHRLLLGNGRVGSVLRDLEGWLAARASVLITSSPAFVTEYFQKRSRVNLPVLLLENKVYIPPQATDIVAGRVPRAPGPPWRIGWFGAIRCRESLRLLTTLVAQSEGRVQVVIRGRPAYDQFDDFDRLTTGIPGLQFLGPYGNPQDLPGIYGNVHFTWAIDRFEAGLNSAWLLPNRLYEGGLFASVPLAEASVETGRFLDRLKLGVTLPDDLGPALGVFFKTLKMDEYNKLQARMVNTPLKIWTFQTDDCKQVLKYLRDVHASKENKR